MVDVARDVSTFHKRFGLALDQTPEVPPRLLPDDLLSFRLKFIEEELQEFKDDHARGDVAGAADALVDLVYVIVGTALHMGLNWDAHWAEVQRANLAKERPSGPDDPRLKGRAPGALGGRFDVVKPADWVPPNHASIIEAAQADYHLRHGRPASAKVELLVGRLAAGQANVP